jgi:cell division protein YceG involved in septum cleavage
MTSIDAALWPLETCSDLYFVARGDGGHIFSQTLQEHNEARRAIGSD